MTELKVDSDADEHKHLSTHKHLYICKYIFLCTYYGTAVHNEYSKIKLKRIVSYLEISAREFYICVCFYFCEITFVQSLI